MTNENLENIKNEYNRLISLKKDLQDAEKRKMELEQTSQVKEYLQLVKTIESYSDSSKLNEEQVINKVIENEIISETNNIFVCMGFYDVSGSLVSKNDVNADYRIYYDIEKGRLFPLRLQVKECEEFERNNIVLYPSSDNSEEYYDKIRNHFLKTAIECGQEVAKEKIQYRYNLQKNNNLENKKISNRIYGLDPGCIENILSFNMMDEVDLYFQIEALSKYILKYYQKKDLTEEQYALEYMVYQTTKFGVELPEPVLGEHIAVTPSYNAWYGFYFNHFKKLSKEELDSYKLARKKGKDVSKFLPKGKWDESLKNSFQKTLE